MRNSEIGPNDPLEQPAKYDTKSEVKFLSEEDWETEKDRIINELTEKSAGDFRLYKNAEYRNSFRDDVEKMCRHAFAINADVMLFCDKSARGHGLLAHKIMPIVRLEYSKLKNIPINEIKIPDIKFFDPELNMLEKKYLTADEGRKVMEELSQESDENITIKNEAAKKLEVEIKGDYYDQLRLALEKFITGKTVLVCDESTTGENFTVPRGDVEPSEQYDFYNDDSEVNQERAALIKDLEISPMLRIGKTYKITHELLGVFPNTHFDVHLGESDIQGGNDKFSNSELDFLIKNIESSEEIMNFGNSIEIIDDPDSFLLKRPKIRTLPHELNVKKAKPFVKIKNSTDEQWMLDNMKESGFKEINELRTQYRAELKKIAAESAEKLLK